MGGRKGEDNGVGGTTKVENDENTGLPVSVTDAGGTGIAAERQTPVGQCVAVWPSQHSWLFCEPAIFGDWAEGVSGGWDISVAGIPALS